MTVDGERPIRAAYQGYATRTVRTTTMEAERELHNAA